MAEDNSDLEHTELNEADPTEEVGPDRCQVGAEECGEPARHGEKAQESEFLKVEELHDAYQPNPVLAMAEDGMPYEVDPNVDLPEAPDFTRENVVCLEDDRTFVELFKDEVTVDSDYRKMSTQKRYGNNGGETVRRRFAKSEIAGTTFGVPYVIVKNDSTEETLYVPVRPIRPKCIHFRRQLFSNDDQQDEALPGHRILFRNCAARRSVGGAAMSIRDEAIFACDWREPRDLPSEERFLESFDQKLLAKYENKDSKKHLLMIDD